MTTRARTVFARAWLLLGMLAWLVVSSGSLLHEVQVQHAVCADHGEVVELANSQAVIEAAAPGVYALDHAEDHDHGCLDLFLQLQSTTVAAVVMPPPMAVEHATDPRLALTSPARGPPLAYAPKTSPPPTS